MKTGHPVNLYPIGSWKTQQQMRITWRVWRFQKWTERHQMSSEHERLGLFTCIDVAFARKHMLVDTEQCDLSDLWPPRFHLWPHLTSRLPALFLHPLTLSGAETLSFTAETLSKTVIINHSCLSCTSLRKNNNNNNNFSCKRSFLALVVYWFACKS